MVNGRFKQLDLPIPPGPISAFLEDAEQSIWIATYGNGVFRLHNGKLTSFSVKDGLPDARVAGLYRDRSGKIWTAGWKGLSFWNGARFVSHQAINAVVSYAITCTEDRDGNLWVATSSGLVRAQAKNVNRMDRSSGLSGDFVSDVFEDNEGSLWVATRGGLDRLRAGHVRTFTHREGLIRDPGPVISDSRNGVWTVSSKQVARVTSSKISVWPMALPTGSTPRTMLFNLDSRLLVGFEGGLQHWSRKHPSFGPEVAGLDVRSLLQARDGNIWIGTANRGLLRWRSSLGTRTLVETGVSDTFISTLAEDRAGAIWAGSTTGGGLYRITKGEVRGFGPAEGLRSTNVYTIFVDDDGNVWIGSANGLSWFQDGRIRTVNSQQGMPSDQIFAIIDDSQGRLWFTGYGGITAIEKKSLFEWAAGQRPKLNPTVYRSADGLQVWTQGRTFPNAVRSTDGHLWFSIADGLSEVTPPAPHDPQTRAFPVFVEDVTIDRVSHLEPSQIRVPAGSRSVEIRYTALTLSNAEMVRFRYRLEGIDIDWVDADARRVAYYNNLKPRAYVFRVSASTGAEQWQESSALVLEQLPFFYQTRWFLLLASASAVALVFLAHRFHLQRAVNRIEAGFQERMGERTRIAQELHDTVVQAICGSTMLVENAAEKVPNSLPVVKGALLRAVDRLDLALAESRAALKGLRSSGSFENTLANQLSDAAIEAQTPNMAFRLAIRGESRVIRPVIQYEVCRIASEAIVNSFKHSGGSSISVDLDYLNGLRVFVQDNGKGVSEQVLRQGRDGHFGLAGMRERADRIGATLDVSSRASEGTEVSLKVPADLAFEDGTTSSLLMRTLSRLADLRKRRAPHDERPL